MKYKPVSFEMKDGRIYRIREIQVERSVVNENLINRRS